MKDIFAEKRKRYENLNNSQVKTTAAAKKTHPQFRSQEEALAYVRTQTDANIVGEVELFRQINNKIEPFFERTAKQIAEEKNREFHLVGHQGQRGHVVITDTFTNIHPIGKKNDSDWKFHISVDPNATNYKKAFKIIYQYCMDNKLSFKVVKWNRIERFSENTRQQGKFFTIYFPKENTKSIACKLLDAIGPQLKQQNIKPGPVVRGDHALSHDGPWFYYRNQQAKRGVNAVPHNMADIFQTRRRHGPRNPNTTPLNPNVAGPPLKTSRVIELKQNVNGDTPIPPQGAKLEDIVGKKQAEVMRKDAQALKKNTPKTKSQTVYTPFDIEYQEQQKTKTSKPAFNPFDIDHTNALEKNDGRELPFRESTAPTSKQNNSNISNAPNHIPSRTAAKNSDAFFKRMCNYVSKNRGKMVKAPPASGGNPFIYPITTAIEMLGGYFGSMMKGWADYLINVSVSYFASLVATTGSFFSSTQALIIRMFGSLPKTCSVLLTVNGFCNSVCGYLVRGGSAVCNAAKTGGQMLLRLLMKVASRALMSAILAVKAAGLIACIKVVIVAGVIVGFYFLASWALQLLYKTHSRVKTKIFVKKNGAFSMSKSCLDGPRVGRLVDIPEDILPQALRRLKQEHDVPEGYLSQEHYQKLLIIGQEIQLENRRNVPNPFFREKEVMHFPLIVNKNGKKAKRAAEIHEARQKLASVKASTEARLKKGAGIINKIYADTCVNTRIQSNIVIKDSLKTISYQTNRDATMLFDSVNSYYGLLYELTEVYYYYRGMKLSKSRSRRQMYKKKFNTLISKYKHGLKKKSMLALFEKYHLVPYYKKLKKLGPKSFKSEIKNREKEFQKFSRNAEKYVALIAEVLKLQNMVEQKIKMMDDETMINLSGIRAALLLDQPPVAEPR